MLLVVLTVALIVVRRRGVRGLGLGGVVVGHIVREVDDGRFYRLVVLWRVVSRA